MTIAEEVDVIKTLDRLHSEATASGTSEAWKIYENALDSYRGPMLKKFWTPVSAKPQEASAYPRRVRLDEALTSSIELQPIQVIEKWRQMVLSIRNRVGTLEERIKYLDEGIVRKKEEEEPGT